ncbi:MAG: TOBE domain-containing protein, partial [Pseudomonadota bacterium]
SGHPPAIPDAVRAEGPGQLHGDVILSERLGSETVVEVRLRDGTPLIAALTRDAVFQLGTPVNLGFDPGMTHLFAR